MALPLPSCPSFYPVIVLWTLYPVIGLETPNDSLFLQKTNSSPFLPPLATGNTDDHQKDAHTQAWTLFIQLDVGACTYTLTHTRTHTLMAAVVCWCNVLCCVKVSIRGEQIIRVSERDQTMLPSAPTHGWFTGRQIKYCSSLSGATWRLAALLG